MKASEAWRKVQMIYTSKGCVEFSKKIDEHLMQAEMNHDQFAAPEEHAMKKLSSKFGIFARASSILLVVLFIAVICFLGRNNISSYIAAGIIVYCIIIIGVSLIVLCRTCLIMKDEKKEMQLLQECIDWREASIACLSRAIFLEKLEKMGLQYTPEEEKAVSGVLSK